ncbi:MAG: hypothetical protein SFZ03_03155 [Candidatus Melainabacteria bacterium]|nr:hypothetical protein [Candidatus Melainabacteria bacterium]
MEVTPAQIMQVQNFLDRNYSDYQTREGGRHGINNGLTSRSAWVDLANSAGNGGTGLTIEQYGELGGDPRNYKVGRTIAIAAANQVLENWDSIQLGGQPEWTANGTYSVPPNPGQDNTWYTSNRELSHWANNR